MQRCPARMATIQIRDVPDDVHESLAALAKESGQSLQAYVRQQVVEVVRSRTRKAAALAELERYLERDGGLDVSAEQIVADLHQVLRRALRRARGRAGAPPAHRRRPAGPGPGPAVRRRAGRLRRSTGQAGQGANSRRVLVWVTGPAASKAARSENRQP